MTGVRVTVVDRPEYPAVDVFVWEHGEDDRAVALLEPNGRWRRLTSDDHGVAHTPTFRVDERVVHPLLAALNAHYGGGDDHRKLREDYDAERARVDGLIATVSSIATEPRR